MTTSRNPMKDQVAIVGVGATKYGRDLKRTPNSLALEAARKAIIDSGIPKEEIDGIGGSGSGFTAGPGNFLALHQGLGLGKVTWAQNHSLVTCVQFAAHAVFSGACEAAVVAQVYMRSTGMSNSAKNDPWRVRFENYSAGFFPSTRNPNGDIASRWFHSGEPYAAWARRYMHEFDAPRQVFGYLAVNNRTNAAKNPAAVMRTPITMDDYLNSRQIRQPLGMLDMDLPVDAAEAIVITTAERARRLNNKHKPVYIHATTIGQSGSGVEGYENGASWTATAPWVALPAVWPKSDLKLKDMDLFFPYDGFTPIAVSMTEAAGFCGAGEAYRLFKDSWSEKEQRLRLLGKTYVSTNGGSMSHGRMMGFNYVTEAVIQLRGEAEPDRQIPNAKAALVASGSFYHDPTATILRAD